MKKVFSILLVVLLIVSLTSVSALAHGGHGGGHGKSSTVLRQQQSYTLCTVDGCDIIGRHQHGDYWYCSQSGCQGGYEICSVSGCTEYGLHEHDGSYYYCSLHGTGQRRGRGC